MRSIATRKGRLHGYKSEDECILQQDLRSAVAIGSTWKRAQFRDCKMSVSRFTNSSFEEVSFLDCNLDLTDFQTCKFRKCVFTNCNIEQVAFGTSVLDDVQFISCRMAYSSLWNCSLRGVVFDDVNLHGADLRFLENFGCEFIHSNLWSAQVGFGCPFFNSKFDTRTSQQFVGMVARVFPDDDIRRKLKEIAGRQFDVVERLMREGE
jgi:uncharacterized protein YjbI with pentapeptide repeats